MLRDDHRGWTCLRCCRWGAICGRRAGIRLAAVLRHLPGGFLHGEAGDRLLFAVIEEVEICLSQVGDGLAVGISDHDGYQHQIGLGPEGWGRLLSRQRGRGEEQESQTTGTRNVHSTTSNYLAYSYACVSIRVSEGSK